jgi:hypothetical protein
MIGYKLFRLMSVLAKPELGEMDKFLQSPFYNTHQECSQLFHQLSRFHPEMENPKLTKEYLFARVYGKIPFDDGKMRKLMTRLSGLLEQFLMVKALEQSPEFKSKTLIRSLAGRSDYGLFKAAVDARMNELEQQPERGREYFREMYQLFQALFFHSETSKFTLHHDYFQQFLSNFESYFMLVTLQNGTESILRRRIVQHQDEQFFLEAADNIARDTGMAQIPLVKFFHQIFRLYQAPKEEVDLEQLRDLLEEIFDLLGYDEQRMALKLLINYAIPYTNQGSAGHTKFIFELYKIGVGKGMLIVGDSAVNTDLFLNIVTTGLLVGEFEWTQYFMQKYGELLPDDEREVALRFCAANWHYYNGMYLDSMTEFEASLQSINLIPVRASEKFDLRTRSLQLRVSYEVFKREADSLDNVLAMARNFQRHIAANHTYSEAIKGAYFQFIHHYKVLSRLTNDPDTAYVDVEKAITALEADKNCIMRKWLDEKLKGLLT